MAILVEGCKNCGKTYLIESSGLESYKFPFIRYFDTFLSKHPGDTGGGSSETYHFSTGHDVTILTMIKQNLVSADLLIDRSFLSNVVLGEMQERISEKEGFAYLSWLASQDLLNAAPMIYIDKHDESQGRDFKKDDWEDMSYITQKDLYEKYFDYLKRFFGYEPVRIMNNFDEDSVNDFKFSVADILKNKKQ